MKPEFVRCEYCKVEIPTEACKLAAHHAVIKGKEYLFCCASCAERYTEKQTKQTRKK